MILGPDIALVLCRASATGACRARVTMMPIGTPKVPYRTPGEGGWQWVDIWNVLVSGSEKHFLYLPSENQSSVGNDCRVGCALAVSRADNLYWAAHR